jgi:hypothetical protein
VKGITGYMKDAQAHIGDQPPLARAGAIDHVLRRLGGDAGAKPDEDARVSVIAPHGRLRSGRLSHKTGGERRGREQAGESAVEGFESK